MISHRVLDFTSPAMYVVMPFSRTQYTLFGQYACTCTYICHSDVHGSRAEHALSIQSDTAHTHARCLQGPKREHTATTNRAATFASALVPSIDDVCSSILQVRVQRQHSFKVSILTSGWYAVYEMEGIAYHGSSHLLKLCFHVLVHAEHSCMASVPDSVAWLAWLLVMHHIIHTC